MNKKIIINFIVFSIIVSDHLHAAAQADAILEKNPALNFNVHTSINPTLAYASEEHKRARANLSTALKECGNVVKIKLQEKLKQAQCGDHVREDDDPEFLKAEIKFTLDGKNDLKTKVDFCPAKLKLGQDEKATLIAHLQQEIEHEVAEIKQKFKEMYPERAPDRSQLLIHVIDYSEQR